MCQTVTQSMAYLLSVMMLTSLFLGTISSARRIAVSSARWLVCRGPVRVSERFLLVCWGLGLAWFSVVVVMVD